ncbi:hypothetical protein C8R47DRAFT_1090649 [Mycena vitilis]|nr:hypothetical protein C8R47DRAFT_1090649 [Mycena vitilis]
MAPSLLPRASFEHNVPGPAALKFCTTPVCRRPNTSALIILDDRRPGFTYPDLNHVRLNHLNPSSNRASPVDATRTASHLHQAYLGNLFLIFILLVAVARRRLSGCEHTVVVLHLPAVMARIIAEPLQSLCSDDVESFTCPHAAMDASVVRQASDLVITVEADPAQNDLA